MARYRNLLLLAALLASATLAGAQTTWRCVSTFHFTWNGHTNVEVILEIPTQWNDPGDFTRIRILVPQHKAFVLRSSGGWVRYKSEMASVWPAMRARKNLVSSPYVLALQAASGRTLLFLTGYSYASSPGSLTVLEISPSGRPRVILHRETSYLVDLRDLNHDGLPDIVGVPCMSEALGNDLLTYQPFDVYTLAATPANHATLSLPLSRRYNLRHYYGWVGPNCSDKVAVVLHPPGGGKPFVTNLKNAEKITSRQ